MLGVVALLGAGVALLPATSVAGPSVSQLSSAIGSQRSRAQSLAASARTLGSLIVGLDRQVALIEGRRAELEAELAGDQRTLAGVRGDRTAARARLVRLAARLTTARRVLGRELLTSYESDPPDIVSVVLAAHGFADLLDRLEFVRIAKAHERSVISDTRKAKLAGEATARRLAVLEVRDRTATDAAATRARAVAAIDQFLQGRRAALNEARAARLASLAATRNRTGELQRALAKLRAELAAGAGRAYGSWAIPQAIVTCESGGQNLGPNSAGASGYYQFLPSTWAGLGGSTPAAYLAPKTEQDRLAAKLWDGGRGASNWVCAGILGIR